MSQRVFWQSQLMKTPAVTSLIGVWSAACCHTETRSVAVLYPLWFNVTSGHCSSVNFTFTTFTNPHIWRQPEHFWNNWQHQSNPANHSSVYIRGILLRVERLLPSCLAWSGLLCCCPLTANILKLYSFKGSKSPMTSFASCFETWTSFCSPSVPR